MSDNRIKLTPVRVQALACESGKTFSEFWDTEAQGLGLRVTANGARSYFFQFRIDGKAARMTIGATGTWAIGDARKEATRLKVLVNQGIDPRDEKKAKTEEREARKAKEKEQALTLKQLWDAYVEEHGSGWSASHLRDHHAVMREPGLPVPRLKSQKTIAGPLWSLAPLRVVDVPTKIESWLKEETERRPTLARKSYVLLKTCLSWHGVDLVGALDGKQKARVKRLVPKPKVKNDVLESSQLAVWWREVGRLGFVSGTFLKVLLLIGCRMSELAALKWSDVDLQWSRITLKNKDASGLEPTRTIPLTPHVRQLLLELKEKGDRVDADRAVERGRRGIELNEDKDMVFRAIRGYGGTHNVGRDHTEATKAAGLPHLTQHGLRRSFITLAEEAGIPSGAAAQICGHKPSALVERNYKRRSQDVLLAYAAQYENFVLERVEKPK